MDQVLASLRRTLRPVREYARTVRHRAGDAFLGIRTIEKSIAAIETPTTAPGGTEYETISYHALRALDQHLPLDSSDIVYDLGCGMGTAVCWFARKTIKGSFGVEYDPPLAEAARMNLARLRGRRATRVGVETADAATAYFDDATVIFLYNPFDHSILRPILARVTDIAASRKMVIRLAYLNPVHSPVFAEFPRLKETARFSLPYKKGKMETLLFKAE